jgi:acyl-CoA thioesterase-2
VGSGTAALLDLLDLEAIEVNLFRGQSPHGPVQRVFGGQVAAQALVAAGRTVEAGTVHSLHSYFLRPGDPSAPILYEVDRIRDGRSFTTRRVVAIQHGRAIFNLHCSFHRGGEVGLEHQDSAPAVPRPEELTAIHLPGTDPALPVHFRNAEGLEVRFVTELPWVRPHLGLGGEREQLWLRFEERLPDDPLVHAAVVTFASDLTLVDTVLQRHGVNPWGEEFIGASLDHCMWFHRDFRADEWLLYDQQSPTASGARGFALGSLYSEGGELVASVAQEGLVRFRQTAG